jgi:hypothetical protein
MFLAFNSIFQPLLTFMGWTCILSGILVCCSYRTSQSVESHTNNRELALDRGVTNANLDSLQMVD